MSVMTVAGRVPASVLGVTAPHEHILIDTTNFFTMPESDPDRAFAMRRITSMRDLSQVRLNPSGCRDNFILDDPALQMSEIDEFRKAGGNTVVDLTLPGIGRNVRFLQQVSRQTGMHVIAGTGFYVASSHPAAIHDASSRALADIMLSEIRDGIDGTEVRPGVIGEIGVGYAFHPREKRVVEGAAIAHKESGLPISIHVSPWCANGVEAMEILTRERIDPTRVCICHIDGENRRDYIHRLLDTGAYIEFDNFGKEFSVLNNGKIKKEVFGKFVSDWQREELLIELIDEGYADQLLVSCDVCLKMFLLEYGGHGYAHFIRNIVPELLLYGVPQPVIDKLIVENPARFLDAPE